MMFLECMLLYVAPPYHPWNKKDDLRCLIQIEMSTVLKSVWGSLVCHMLKNQIFCLLRIHCFYSSRQTSTLASAINLQWKDVLWNLTAVLNITCFMIYVLLDLAPPEGHCFITYPGVIHLILSISADNKLNHM